MFGMKTYECEWMDRVLEDGSKIPTTKEVLEWLNDHFFGLYEYRDQYVSKYCFPLITVEALDELAMDICNVLSETGKSKVLEVCCGSGYLGSLLKIKGIDIVCTDNHNWRDDERRNKKFFRTAYTDIEELDAVEAVEKYHDDIGCVILSWPEYESDLAEKVLRKCLEYGISMIYIGEDLGGCTADDGFFNLIEEECDEIMIVHSYVQFDGMHDYVSLITKKTSS
ncbi:MAG: hypothetical protein NC131_13530 [Roseburia sp.]|nr:hypothetical protein [Roseburia sp.]